MLMRSCVLIVASILLLFAGCQEADQKQIQEENG